MGAIKGMLLVVVFCQVVIFVLGTNEQPLDINNGDNQPRQFDFLDSILSDIKIDKQVLNQGSSVFKKVTSSSGSGGQTIVKTEVTEILGGGNPLAGMRFKRDLFDGGLDFMDNIMDSVGNKVQHAHDKIHGQAAGVISDAVNLGSSAINKVTKLRQ